MTMPDSTNSDVPSEFLCPITHSIMKEPMMSRYGMHYEKAAILQWLEEGHNYCPISHKPLRPSNLISDKNMQQKISFWRQQSHNSVSCPATPTAADKPKVLSLLSPGYIAILPDRFKCPLTKEVMEDPVMTRTGVNYERSAILQHLDQQGYYCPRTELPLKPSGIVANCKLQWEIQQWNVEYGGNGALATAQDIPSTPVLPPLTPQTSRATITTRQKNRVLLHQAPSSAPAESTTATKSLSSNKKAGLSSLRLPLMMFKSPKARRSKQIQAQPQDAFAAADLTLVLDDVLKTIKAS